MFECIICKEDYDDCKIVWSDCAHGPYCNSCYSKITSTTFPKCSLCRKELTQTSNTELPNQSDIDFESNRYSVLEVIHSRNDLSPTNLNNPPNQKEIYNEARKNRQRQFTTQLLPSSLNFLI